jgi:hypothetical protein
MEIVMDLIKLCALCDQDLTSHDVIFVDGTEGYACYNDKTPEDNARKLNEWIESMRKRTVKPTE